MRLKWVIFASVFLALSANADEGFKNESELGLVLTDGNTEAQTTNFKQTNSYGFGSNLFKFSAAFLQSSNNGVESAKAWNLGLRYELSFNQKLSSYLGQGVEADKFAKIKQRYKTDIGAKYVFKKTERWVWFLESGYRFTKENSYILSRNLHYARAYSELEKKWNPSVSTKYWVEYLPNISQGKDWQLNTELSTLATLSEVFSIKSALLVRYDNEPNAGVSQKTDRILTTALVARF